MGLPPLSRLLQPTTRLMVLCTTNTLANAPDAYMGKGGLTNTQAEALPVVADSTFNFQGRNYKIVRIGQVTTENRNKGLTVYNLIDTADSKKCLQAKSHGRVLKPGPVTKSKCSQWYDK